MRLTSSQEPDSPRDGGLALAASAGCQRLPYIDQSKAVPHDSMGTIAAGGQGGQAGRPTWARCRCQLPKMAKPRTTNNPEAQEIWPMTLQEAIQIGLDNSEVIRVISLGAQGIPIGGFEPTPLNTGAGAGAGGRHAGHGLRPGHPGDPDRPGALGLRHRLDHQPVLGPQRDPVQQRVPGRCLHPGGAASPSSSSRTPPSSRRPSRSGPRRVPSSG